MSPDAAPVLGGLGSLLWATCSHWRPAAPRPTRAPHMCLLPPAPPTRTWRPPALLAGASSRASSAVVVGCLAGHALARVPINSTVSCIPHARPQPRDSANRTAPSRPLTHPGSLFRPLAHSAAGCCSGKTASACAADNACTGRCSGGAPSSPPATVVIVGNSCGSTGPMYLDSKLCAFPMLAAARFCHLHHAWV